MFFNWLLSPALTPSQQRRKKQRSYLDILTNKPVRKRKKKGPFGW